MKKIPTLFVRNPENMKLVTDQVTPGLEDVLTGKYRATVKFDGSAVKIDRWGNTWKRREVKAGKPTPTDFQEVGEHNGKKQGWVPIGGGAEDKWFRDAIGHGGHAEATYEAIGPKFQGGAEKTPDGINWIYKHGDLNAYLPDVFSGPFTFDTIHKYLKEIPIEGLVWWDGDKEPVAKIKRRDFGLEWPIKQESTDAGE